jgi:hypothetical protein
VLPLLLGGWQAQAPPPRSDLAWTCEAGWIRWNERFSFQAFLDQAKPSTIARQAPHSAWVTVSATIRQPRNEGRRPLDESEYLALPEVRAIQACVASKGRLSAAMKDAATNAILAKAARDGETCGKWMLFPTVDKVDTVWAMIATATRNNELGCATKVATQTDDARGTRLICVYCADFTDRASVMRVRETLSTKLAAMAEPVPINPGFKPDIFTNLGINTGNQWRLSPTLPVSYFQS